MDQPTLELMRQLVEYSGFVSWIKINEVILREDVYYVGAMAIRAAAE